MSMIPHLVARFGLILVLVCCFAINSLMIRSGNLLYAADPADRPSEQSHQNRSTAVATQGMVATSHPLAALVGVDILQAGGNAVDAAIATNAMLGLVEPMSCGIGGDLFVIYWDAKTERLYGLNASGRSPYAINRQVFDDQDLDMIPIEGPLSWSVPGCVDGWFELHGRFGSTPMNQILRPSIDYGRNGFAVTEVIAGYWKGAEETLAKYPDSASTFLIDGKAPAEGDVFRNANLARSYELIADQGGDAFYRGSIAQEIVEFSQANGGYLSMKDFDDHTSNWVEPVSTNYRGYDVWELPPNGQGIAALEMLNVLEGFDLRSMGPNSPEYWHLLVEAKKLAFADRAKFYSDPDFNRLPVAELISKPYAEKQRKRINRNQAATDVEAGDPKLVHGDTIYLTVVDKDRNCCSFIQSNYYGFGSKVVPGNVGFPMQNRGALFALQDDHLNRLEPHKRPFHTIIPAMVTKDGKPWLSFGVMGGDMQPQGHVQVLVNLIDFGMNVQSAGDAARVRHVGSQQPTGALMSEDGGTVNVESGISDEIVQALSKKGHNVDRVDNSGYGGYQAIMVDWDRGTIHGGSERRKDGIALGY